MEPEQKRSVTTGKSYRFSPWRELYRSNFDPSPRYARGDPDQPPSGYATPEVAAKYFRRLRLYNIAVVSSFLLIVAGAGGAALLHGTGWSIVVFIAGFLLSLVVSLSTDSFFRCPACGYIFQTGKYGGEPKWHACPSCGIQFTSERKLRSPSL